MRCTSASARHSDPGSPCAGARLAWLLWACLIALPAVAGGEIVDRIVAIVDRQVITLSDVRAALDLGLIEAADETAARDALVERALMLAEVSRYAPPLPAEVPETRLEAIRARLGREALEATLRRTGLSLDWLRLTLRQDALIQSYLDQRFDVTAMPTDEQVEAFYRERRHTFVDATGAELPMEAALPIAHAQLTASRRSRLVAEWQADLRRRAQISVRSPRP